MRKLIALTALLLLPLALAAPAHALDEDDGDGTDASIPDYVYAGPFVDNSQIPDSPKRTTFKLAGKDTITATTWYPAWNGRILRLVASYPRYPQKQRLPLVRVFHGAGGRAVCNQTFGNAPGAYGFVVACLDGTGRHARGYSYGSPESLADNAKILEFLRARLPGLRIDANRQVAAGGSMGGQDALLFGAKYPAMAQTIVAMDAPIDMSKRFWKLPTNRQHALFQECQGTPYLAPACFADRSPLTFAANLANSNQTLIMYWSVNDEISPQEQMPTLARAIHAANPARKFLIRVGNWGHGGAWPPATRNNEWLADAGLVADGVRADTKHPNGWRIEVDASTDLGDIPSYYPK
ncbi:MAG: prolyl oligopeptidase family serine peptidase [Gaiellales bacterium]|jgi:pimeloyl-ACP methyl ester carboxylesterase|nr:prolyl oligopeptidase family serine peptidase [Gaiellales bacterium]